MDKGKYSPYVFKSKEINKVIRKKKQMPVGTLTQTVHPKQCDSWNQYLKDTMTFQSNIFCQKAPFKVSKEIQKDMSHF